MLYLEIISFDLKAGVKHIKDVYSIDKTFRRHSSVSKFGSKYIISAIDSSANIIHYRVFDQIDITLQEENSIAMPIDWSRRLIGIRQNTLIFTQRIKEHIKTKNKMHYYKVLEDNLLLINSSEDVFNLRKNHNHFTLERKGVYSNNIIQKDEYIPILTEYLKNPFDLSLKKIEFPIQLK